MSLTHVAQKLPDSHVQDPPITGHGGDQGPRTVKRPLPRVRPVILPPQRTTYVLK